jgi:phosphonoacetaldehyde hydrolase
MPIRLLLVDGRGPIPGPEFDALADRLRTRGVRVETLVASDRPEPWAIFDRMRGANVYPPGAVMVAAANEGEVVEAKNAGAWAVGVTDACIGAGVESPTEEDRNRFRSLFLDAGADAAVDSIAELADAIEAIDGLM